MPVSINALFGIPTRDEKERKRAQGQASVDRISEMNLADELTRGQLRYAKELGLEFTEKELDALKKQNIESLKTAGDATPEVTEARGRTSELKGKASDWTEKNFGFRMGNPEAKAAAEAAQARYAKQRFSNEAARAEGAAPYQSDLGAATAGRELIQADRDRMLADTDITLEPTRAGLLEKEMEQRRQAAQEYLDPSRMLLRNDLVSQQRQTIGESMHPQAIALRRGQLDNDIAKAGMLKQYMDMIGGDPMQDPLRVESMVNPNIRLSDQGVGVTPGLSPMTPLGRLGGGTAPVATGSSPWDAIGEAIIKRGKLAQ